MFSVKKFSSLAFSVRKGILHVRGLSPFSSADCYYIHGILAEILMNFKLYPVEPSAWGEEV